MQHWYTWPYPDYKHSFIFELLFCLTKEQCHMLLWARHQTWVCSKGKSGGSAVIWVGRVRFHMGRCENTETIPYCFPTCYLQCHKQILKLYVLILNAQLEILWGWNADVTKISWEFAMTSHRLGVYTEYIKMIKPGGWTVSVLMPCRPYLQCFWDNMKW